MKILANIVLVLYGFLTVTNETEVKNVIAKDEVVIDDKLITPISAEEKSSIQQIESKRNLIYTGERLFLNSEEISLNELPKLQTLYNVSKVEIGKWSKLFIAIKMEESGVDGKNSGLARVRNNLVGMRVPRRRETKCVGATSTNYAIFNNWYEAVQDFKIFIDIKERGFKRKFNRAPKDEHEFVDYLYGSYNIYSKWQQDVHIILRNFRLQ
jgi:uncharacterized FlgJ-related protein